MPEWKEAIAKQLAGLNLPPAREAEIVEEVAQHLDDRYHELLAGGATEAEARRAALDEISAEKLLARSLERVERQEPGAPAVLGAGRGRSFFSDLANDLRYAVRVLRKNPGFTAVAVLTLALGMGGNVAVFSLLDAVLLRPLPYAQPERLYAFFPVEAKSHRSMMASSYLNFQDWRAQSHAFEAMIGYSHEYFSLTGTREPERLDGLSSTPGLFALLGVPPLLGREFSANDGSYVAVLTYELWRRRFAGDSAAIGRPIFLEGKAYTVLGILPPHFLFPPSRWEGVPEVFVPVTPYAERGWHYLRVIGRLAPGVTEQEARAEMSGIAARLALAYPKTNGEQGVGLDRLSRSAVSGARETLWLLLGAVAFVLLIACANVANLLLSQGATREREIAIRLAVGATRRRVVRQLLTESLLLAGMGSALGVALAYWTFPLLASVLPRHTALFTRVHDTGFQLNLPVLLFTGLATLIACALFGGLPAWRSTQPARSSAASVRRGGIRGGLIGLEVALSFVLLAGAGLMMKSLIRLLETDVGFRMERLLTMKVDLAGEKYSLAEKQAAFFGEVLKRCESMPSVLAAGAVVDLPMTRSEKRDGVDIPGFHPKNGTAGYHAVSPGYFHTMGMPLLNGREFLPTDTADSPLVGVVSRAMVRKFWPDENPIGKTVVAHLVEEVSTPQGSIVKFKPRELQVVGIVGDIRQLGLDAPPRPELYMPYTQWPSNEMSLVLRISSLSSSVVPALKQEIGRVDPDQPVTDVATMDELVAVDAGARRFVLELLGVFAALAVVLAAVGIYGVVSYGTRQRTHEIGIRMALGARGQEILWLVAGQNASWLLAGILIGAAGALALTRLLGSYLYAVRPTDPLIFVIVALLLLVVALAAVLVPARRATKVDPMVALRYE
jgi:putative ABC transport system permease protein